MRDKQNILIIDDHFMMREFLSTYLSKKYNVHTAEDGVDAIEWLKNNEAPAVILVDIDMPRMNGYDFLNVAKSDARLANTAFVVLSSASESQSRIKAFELGAQDVVEKPFNPRELELRISLFNKQQLMAA